MSDKVTIEPQNIMYFVGEIAGNVSAKLGNLDPRKKPSGKEEKQFLAVANILAGAISRGLILANYQPELAAAAVKEMNQKEPGFVDEELKEMLAMYTAFLIKRREE